MSWERLVSCVTQMMHLKMCLIGHFSDKRWQRKLIYWAGMNIQCMDWWFDSIDDVELNTNDLERVSEVSLSLLAVQAQVLLLPEAKQPYHDIGWQAVCCTAVWPWFQPEWLFGIYERADWSLLHPKDLHWIVQFQRYNLFLLTEQLHQMRGTLVDWL